MLDHAVILLVDDSEEEAYLIHRAFQNAAIPCRLELVMSHDQAIAYLSGSESDSNYTGHPRPDLLLLDLKTGSNRSCLLRWIRNRQGLQSLKVVALTSSCHDSDVNHSYSMGVNSFVVKPTNFQAFIELARALYYWLNKTIATFPTEEVAPHALKAA